MAEGRGRGRRRGYEGSSSSRQRTVFVNEMWPEPFVETLVYKVALDASNNVGQLEAARSIATVFQVCTTWHGISRSDHIWRNLARLIWGRDRLTQDSWRNEYIVHHRTSYNFRIGGNVYTTLEFNDSNRSDSDSLSCRCLTLSDYYLACGFADGVVRLFDLDTKLHVSTIRPEQRDQLGRFSRSVSGIILTNSNLVFASLDGDVHSGIITHGMGPTPRRVQLGNVVTDGTLVSFTGCNRWWVGLFAGLPNRAFHVWDGESEELVFVGGSLTDPEAVMGWHLLTELADPVGRVRMITSRESVVACTGLRLMVFDLHNLNEEEIFERGVIVDAVDVNRDMLLVLDNHGVASVRRVDNMEQVCRFTVRARNQRRLYGCINSGYALICAGGTIRVWEVKRGEFLYGMRERIGEASALIADDRHAAACSSDSRIHLWDFGAG
ncbi:hypothetical protein GIB67_000977 [Kingdonia uniflora]|uniref:Transcriptional regulator STERILE APETALA n=1 Tax=Kingdonia uniflora TaxID=39325 RepID=A0A7J7MG71_9MAGN|nr:hypothetical protein GIB67_000977 [Kingdonia uniflora]